MLPHEESHGKDVNIVSDQLVAKRKDEKYKRIKCSTLAKL